MPKKKSPLVIRPAKLGDIPAIQRVLQAASQLCLSHYTTEQVKVLGNYTAEELTHHINSPLYAYVVAIKEQQIVGVTAVLFDEDAEYNIIDPNLIYKLFVDPAYNGQGIGSALLEHAEALLRTNNRHFACLHARLNAVSFYEQHGYHLTGHDEVWREDGQEMLFKKMEKQL